MTGDDYVWLLYTRHPNYSLRNKAPWLLPSAMEKQQGIPLNLTDGVVSLRRQAFYCLKMVSVLGIDNHIKKNQIRILHTKRQNERFCWTIIFTNYGKNLASLGQMKFMISTTTIRSHQSQTKIWFFGLYSKEDGVNIFSKKRQLKTPVMYVGIVACKSLWWMRLFMSIDEFLMTICVANKSTR